jgi:hypothetical protein
MKALVDQHFAEMDVTKQNTALDEILNQCFLAETLEEDLEEGEKVVDAFLQFTVSEALK